MYVHVRCVLSLTPYYFQKLFITAGDRNFRRRPGLRAKRRACSRVALKTRGRRTRQSNRCMRKLTSELDDINIVVVRGGSRRNTVKTVRIDADVDCDRAFIRRQIRKARKARRECLKELFDSDSDSSSSSEDKKKKKRSTKGSEDDKKKKKKKLITTSSPDDRRYLKKGKSAEEEEEEEEASLKSRKGEQVMTLYFSYSRVSCFPLMTVLYSYPIIPTNRS